MKLFSKVNYRGRRYYNILGIKFSTLRKTPSEMSTRVRTKKLKTVFYKKVGYVFNPKNPITFNEKIQWLKLFYHNPVLTKIVDKYEFKNYIKEQLGEGYTVPLLGVWDDPEKIDFEQLPDKFVLKCNAQSDSKFIKIVRNKKELDIEALRKEMKDWLNPRKTLKSSFCWAYYDVPLRIIAEEYIEQIDGQVYDYKFVCSRGKVFWVLACKDRGNDTIYENYDIDWNLIQPSPRSADTASIPKPKNYEQMLEIAQKLSKDFPLVRVDFYEVNNKILLGEMTFYPNGGYNTYTYEWDEKFGEFIKLPDIKHQPTLFRHKNEPECWNLGEFAKIIGAELPETANIAIPFKKVLTQSYYATQGDYIIDTGWYNSENTISESITKGAAAIFCSPELKEKFPQDFVYSVKNPRKAVERFVTWKTQKSKVKKIVITGSVGKTTTTGLINSIIANSYNTLNHDPMSNSYGAILRTVQKLTQDHEYWVQEVGGVQPGYIESSAVFLKPDIVVLTNISDSHLNLYKTKENIFYDKSSLERFAGKNAQIIINYDDPILKNADYTHKIITVSLKDPSADYYAKDILMNCDGLTFTAVCKRKKEIKIHLNLYGEYNAYNALYAIAVGNLTGVDLEKMPELLKRYHPNGMRQNRMSIGGYSIFVDVFNAEPKTVLGAAKILESLPLSEKGRKIFVTGHIDKIGDASIQMHKDLGKELAKLNLDIILLYAGDSRYTYEGLKEAGFKNAILMNTREELDDWLRKNATRQDEIFFKSGQFEACLVKTVDHIFGTSLQNALQFNNGYTVMKNDYQFHIRKDNIAEITGYIGNDSELVFPSGYENNISTRISPLAFSKNNTITSVVIPDTVSVIGREAFYRCFKLKTVQLPENLLFIDKNAFNSCTSLEEIEIPRNVIHIDRKAFYDCKKLKRAIIYENVGFIGDDTFNNVAEEFEIVCSKESYAEKYAKEKGIKTVYLEKL